MDNEKKMNVHGKSRLENGEELHSGQYLVSPNGEYYLMMRDDGHLVIYNKDKPNDLLWKSIVNSKVENVEGPFKLIMQNDNNSVVYDSKDQAIWHTGIYITELSGQFYLEIDNDGSFHIRDRDDDELIWTSYTVPRCFSGKKEGRSALYKGEELHVDQYLVSPNQQYYLTLLSDGRLVLYGKDEEDTPLWQSTVRSQLPSVESPLILKIKANNDLVVRDGRGQRLWHTNTGSYLYDCRLVLDNNGVLRLHRIDDIDITAWSTEQSTSESYTAIPCWRD